MFGEGPSRVQHDAKQWKKRADAATAVFETSKYSPLAIGAVAAEPSRDSSLHLPQYWVFRGKVRGDVVYH
jgi:hypothetical protein